MPRTESPFDGSWGYQPISLFAPTSRHGGPDDCRAFIDSCHHAGLGLWLGLGPGHFPTHPPGLGRFDGPAPLRPSAPRPRPPPPRDTRPSHYAPPPPPHFPPS